MFKFRVNEKSVSAKIENSEEFLELKAKALLEDLAKDLVTRTPVVTGAYAESFSVLPSSSGGGRRKSSKGRPKGQDKGTYRGIAEANMHSDIDKINLVDNQSLSFRNRAPHASEVIEEKYQVFSQVKDIRR